MSDNFGLSPLIQNEFTGLIGVAHTEINPPSGMYVRTWGSSKHDTADGIHRPLRATCLAIADKDGGPTAFLITCDLMVWMSKEDEEGMRLPLEIELNTSPGWLLLHLSHSHAAPFTDPALKDAPGGDKIESYRSEILAACLRIALEARNKMVQSVLSWGMGKCGLAYNRDLVLPKTGEVVVGVNPLVAADDTLLVGRITDHEGNVQATLVHYAAHPTSLGGGNRLISPDYIGAMRELVERETDDAPCMFLHGADGDLTPRRSFEDNAEAADQNGRELGYAALSVNAGLFPQGQKLEFHYRQESGATLGIWHLTAAKPCYSFSIAKEFVQLKINNLPSAEEYRSAIADANNEFARERARRALALRSKLGVGPVFDLPIYFWRLGQSVFIGAPVEFYSDFQISLRREFPDLTILVLDVCNGFLNYLPPKDEFVRETYPVRISLFRAGSLELVYERVVKLIKESL